MVQGVERVGSIDQECSLCVAAVKVATQGMRSGLRPPPSCPAQVIIIIILNSWLTWCQPIL